MSDGHWRQLADYGSLVAGGEVICRQILDDDAVFLVTNQRVLKFSIRVDGETPAMTEVVPLGAESEIVIGTFFRAFDTLHHTFRLMPDLMKMRHFGLLALEVLSGLDETRRWMTAQRTAISEQWQRFPSAVTTYPVRHVAPKMQGVESKFANAINETSRIIRSISAMTKLVPIESGKAGVWDRIGIVRRALRDKYGSSIPINTFSCDFEQYAKFVTDARNALEHPSDTGNCFSVSNITVSKDGKIVWPTWHCVRLGEELSQDEDVISSLEFFLEASLRLFEEIFDTILLLRWNLLAYPTSREEQSMPNGPRFAAILYGEFAA